MHARATLLDRMVNYWSPKRGTQRMAARMVQQELLEHTERAYDGASRGRRTDGWHTSGSSANAELRWALPIVRNRSRDLVRNDGHATKALRTLTNNVVGAGIIATIKTPSDRDTDVIGRLWEDWAESPACSSDERMTFYSIQSLAMRCIVESGEVLIRRIRARSADSLPVPLQLQVLEPDYIDTLKEEPTSGGGFIFQGIEYNSRGKRVAYWLFDEHPGEMSLALKPSFKSMRVPAEDICHVFDMTRAGQVRGISWFAPAIIKFKDHGDFSEAILLKHKLAAYFTGFVTEPEGMAAEVKRTKKDTLPEKLEPGAFKRLRPGEQVSFPNAPVTSSALEVSVLQLRACAAAIGVTYEDFTGDYSQVTFTSGRMGWLEFGRSMHPWRHHMLIPHLCGRTFGWFREAASMKGYRADEARALWTPPAREMIDPGAETNAAVNGIRAGLKSLSETIREGGEDPNKVLAQVAADNAKCDELGLILDSDPRKVMKAGILQPDNSGSGAANNGGKNASA